MLDMTKGICALCSHNKLVKSWPIDHGSGNSTYNIAAAQQIGSWGKTQQFGQMVAYICQRCGFVMWFAVNAKDIPIGEEFCTTLIEGPIT